MKTLNIVLPDWAFNKALELAKSHGVTEQAYISTLVVEHLSNHISPPAPAPSHAPAAAVQVPVGAATAATDVRKTFASARDTLTQVLMVCVHVYENGDVPKDDVHCNAMYRMAVRKVAKELGIQETTVRDKCSTDRRLGPADTPINQAKFISWLRNPACLREHLCQKFPEFKTEIRKQFSAWLPSLPAPFRSRPTPSPGEP